MFNFVKKALQKIYQTCTSKLNVLFSRSSIDQQTLSDLEKILIESDTGVKTTKHIIANLKSGISGSIDGQAFKNLLQDQLVALLHTEKKISQTSVILLVGINGSGKTTLAAKLAFAAKQQGKKVLLVAADTFRAAAQEQLGTWAQKLSIDIEMGKQGQDPASVVFAGCQRYAQHGYNVLIIDTAGRLQTKINLMKELEKIKRVITQQLPKESIFTLLTIDSMLGQNSLEQARTFNESTTLDAVALTKLDGTGKGGIIFAIAHELGIPVAYIAFGEQIDQLKMFDAQEYVQDLLNS
jgi:fused signal recognition particle receptor